jgi:single-stranded DNA-binding protein
MLNKCILIGHVGERGVTLSPLPESGAMVAQFLLGCDETGTDGRTYTSWFLCEAYGRAREQAEHLEAGELVCLEGKLKRKKRVSKSGETSYETVVMAWTLTPVRGALVQG